jgi:dipeptidyl aminopeptidase/acylaminoacyl peptidase
MSEVCAVRNRAVLAVGVALVAIVFSAEVAHAAFPGKNGLIGFSLQCCSGSDLEDYGGRLIHPDGGRMRRLDGGAPFGVAFSPDGSRIAYADAFGFGLRVQRADGRGREHTLTRGSDFDPDWSPNGQRVVFSRLYEGDDYRQELRIKEGTGSRPLTDGSDPAWSAKGKIAFVHSDGGIYVIRPDGSGLRRVVEQGAEPDWSPDGRLIVYTRRAGIWVVRAGGGGARRLHGGSSPSFSPNGRQIVYIGGRGRLQIMGAGGKHSMRVPGLRNVDYVEETLMLPDWQPLP